MPLLLEGETLKGLERRVIEETLHETGWFLGKAARKLGISRSTLWRRLKVWGIDVFVNTQ